MQASVAVSAALLVNNDSGKSCGGLQKILRETALEWGAKADAMMHGLGEAGVEATKGFPNAHVFVLSREEQVKWANAMPNIAKEWAERTDKNGLPGSKALTAFMTEIRASGAKPVRDWDK